MDFLGTKVELPHYRPAAECFEHGAFMMWLVRKINPSTIVELGTDHGYSYFAMCQAVREAKLTTACFAVGTWQGGEPTGYSHNPVYLNVADENKKYINFSSLVPKKFAEAASDFDDGSVDLLHIHRCRSYEDVRQAFETWKPKLSEASVVLFHNTEVREQNFGIYRFWSEVSVDKPAFNFLNQRGLGVLFWGDRRADGIRGLLNEFSKIVSEQAVIDYFSLFDAQFSRETVWQHVKSANLPEAIVGPEYENAEFVKRQNLLNDYQDTLSINHKHIEHLETVVAGLRRELADERVWPLKSWKRKNVSKLLYFLAEQDNLFSERQRVKFLRSAQKRDPRRSLFKDSSSMEDAVEADQTEIVSLSKSSEGKKRLDAKTVLIVSHDASRTGAPILALNLIRELSHTCNVVSVILGDGELISEFRNASDGFLKLNRVYDTGKTIATRLVNFCNQHDVSEAFINSIESRLVLPILKNKDVRTIALVHEFASYTRPETAFLSLFENADQIVFSTHTTLDDALEQCSITRPINVHVLPQGKCQIPQKRGGDQEQEKERNWLKNQLRPSGNKNEEFVIIGVGTVQTRKGVDLFIETATRVISESGGAKFRFVWIGGGFDPVHDVTKSVYLSDQIRRAGVQAQVKIIRATSEIECAYQSADLMLLSSRLDPLPNVAIDMFMASKPVLCFDRTTGIADFLKQNDLSNECVADYLSTNDMARKILTLAADKNLLTHVAKRSATAAQKVFNFSTYVQKLSQIADASDTRKKQIETDCDYLLSSQAFRTDFWSSSNKNTMTKQKAIRMYLEANRTGLGMRKPAPGFNQLIYSEEHGWPAAEDPFVHYLKSGSPRGPWALDVIDPTSAIDDQITRSASVALHIHAYYTDGLDDIIHRLNGNKTRPALFVSTAEQNMETVKDILKSYSGVIASIQSVQNRGRDIAPFLTLFGPEMFKKYDIVGHIHTKRSELVKNPELVKGWVNFLLQNLLGGAADVGMMDRIITAMGRSDNVGLVYPDDPHVIDWTANRVPAENLAKRMGLASLPDHFNFPVGTMFWAKTQALKTIADMDLKWDDYPAEPLPYDGSDLHALERLFGVIPTMAGFKTAVTNIKGVSR